jgi:hypothetical protein
MVVIGLWLLLFAFSGTAIFSQELSFKANADFEISSFSGREQRFRDSALGLSRADRDLTFRDIDLNLDAAFSREGRGVRWNLSDRLNLDLFSDRNLRIRDSNYQNSLILRGDLDLSSRMRVKGEGSLQNFEDQSFPEFSNRDLGAIIEIERLLHGDTYLTIGHEVHDLEFDLSSKEDYLQRDFYLSYFRFSPGQMVRRLKSKNSEEAPKGILQNSFKSGTRENTLDHGFFRAASLMGKISEHPIRRDYEVYSLQGDMSFDLEARLRHRELFNDLEKSYLEGQINGSAKFYPGKNHYFEIENRFADRDYSRESLGQNLLSYQENLARLTHFLGLEKISFDHRISFDSVFYKSIPDYDNYEWTLDSSISWDVLSRWNLAWFNAYSKRNYEVPREFFTNNDYRFRSLASTYRMGRGFSLVTRMDQERRTFSFFENFIDSSYNKKTQDYRVEYQATERISYHLGYLWERERHFVFEENDRFERLGYLGARWVL